MRFTRSTRLTAAAIFLVMIGAAGAVGISSAGASHTDTHFPADKVSYSSSNLKALCVQQGTSTRTKSGQTAPPPASDCSDTATQQAVLLSTTMKTSAPTDLILQVTMECSLFTDIGTTVTDADTSDYSLAAAGVEVWVTINDVQVPVSTVNPGPTGTPNGPVTFCDRDFSMSRDLQIDLTDGDQTLTYTDVLQMWLGTKSAHGFNWGTTDVGSGIHEIKVWGKARAATVDETSDTPAFALALIGPRSLVVEPVKLATGSQV